MRKPLPNVKVGPETFATARGICAELIATCRRTADDGSPLFLSVPDADAHGPLLMSTRDLSYLVQGAGDLLEPDEALAALDFILSGQRADGLIPDRMRADGQPIFHAQAGDVAPAAPEHDQQTWIPLDTAAFAVQTMFAIHARVRDHAAFMERRERLYAAMEATPLSEDWQVHVDPNRPRVGYGYTDHVAMTGKLWLCSALHWEACQLLALMLRRCEQHDEAHEWYEAAERTVRRLGQLYDEEWGMFRAASEDCHQVDLWGSLYAGVIRAASKSQTERIAEFITANADLCLYRGHVRHLPAPELWERLLAPVAPESGQNGGYWALPTGWCARVLAEVDEAAAAALLQECVAQWQEAGVREHIGPHTAPGPAGHLPSAAAVLGACRA